MDAEITKQNQIFQKASFISPKRGRSLQKIKKLTNVKGWCTDILSKEQIIV